MSNKFLKIYPQLREPQVGDIIEVNFSSLTKISKEGEINYIYKSGKCIPIYKVKFIGLRNQVYTHLLHREEFNIIKFAQNHE